MKTLSIVGARPQFIKEAMVNRSIRSRNGWNHILVHSGQHYDPGMSDIFFRELDMPAPDYNLDVRSGSHAETTSRVMLGLEPVLQKEKPDCLIVYGDTDTTLAGALTAAKLKIPVAHVEAGERSLPKNTPEEINRVAVDHLSSLLCCVSKRSSANLAAEGIVDDVYICGDIMLDVFKHFESEILAMKNLPVKNILGQPYVLATLHRDYNTDNPKRLSRILSELSEIKKELNLNVVLPAHPRLRKSIELYGLTDLTRNIIFIEPLGYKELLACVHHSKFVITDSGGLQKEAAWLNKRSLLLMPDTCWRELVDCGWNVLCDVDRDKILNASQEMLLHMPDVPPSDIYGSGNAATLILKALENRFA